MDISTIKDILDLLKKGATVEDQEKIMKLREAILEFQEEKIKLKKKVKELQEALEIKESIVYEPPYYFIEKNGEKDGPFCQVCFDNSGKLIRLQEQKQKGLWKCLYCDEFFEDSSYKPPSPPQSSGSWMSA